MITKKQLMDLGMTDEQATAALADMVSKTRLDQVIAERDAAVGQVTERDASIAGLQKTVKGNEALQTTITTLQEQLKQKDAEVAKTQKESAIKLALGTAKAKNPKAVMALLEMDKFELQGDGTVKGLPEALETIKKSDAYLFEAESKPGTPPPPPPPQPGFNPPPGPAAPSGKSLTQLVSEALQGKTPT